MRLEPCVKLNLGLNVIERRPDGFHNLETLFVPYEGLRDVLEIELLPFPEEEPQIEIIFNGNPQWDPQKDLTIKAWRLLKSEYADIPAVKIRLEKHSPVGAGLGGGSSDCAAALRMISELCSLGLDDARLAEYASRLGSDCPFFIYGVPMFGSGRGEILEPFDIDLSSYEIRVEMPAGVSVSTKEAYSGIRPHIPAKPLKEVLSEPVENWKEDLLNDFEASVFPLHPEIESLKQRFYSQGAVYSAMSGSGSAVFALFKK